MKKKFLLILCLFTFLTNYAQFEKAIANTYIKRANNAIANGINYELAANYFEKAMARLDSITDKKTAILGSRIYFEIHHKQETLQQRLEYLKKSQSYFKHYNLLTTNKTTEEYQLNIDELYVPIIESIEKVEEEIKIEKELNRIKKLEKKKIDSLTEAWENKYNTLKIKVDTIFSFNKDNIALYKIDNNYGLINDVGEIILEANEYKDVLYFEGFFIFKNIKNNPTKLLSFNSTSKNSFEIPTISEFYNLSTHFGQVMLPRANGKLVTYPNNVAKPFVFDLNEKKIIEITNEKEILKNLDKADVITKYNNDGEVKINKEWYRFGGDLGGGLHPLYAEESYDLLGFLCAMEGKFLSAKDDFEFIGPFYNNRFEAKKGNSRFWIDQKGVELNDTEIEDDSYLGESIIEKLDDGSYQIKRNGFIILKDKKLEKLSDFINNNLK
uniref:hypothetical protein n=1 Tax=uncultured Polaribacter sp. TaxID=174711 RepID=UPI0026247135|nr:hypothetical protein [uncultured Polaribacter sp.]